MNFIFEWLNNILRTSAASKILFLPRENKINIFKSPCNVLFYYIDMLMTGTAEIRFMGRDTVFYGSAVHLNKTIQNAGNFKLFSHRVLTTAKKAQNLERTL